jgi:hypothetical protein
VLQSSTVFVAVSRGFGETIEDVFPASLMQMEKVSFKALDIEGPVRTYWTGVVIICERYTLHHYYMVNKMLRCIPVPTPISTEEPCSCLECNTHWVNSINGGLCAHCCSTMQSHATVDLHRCAMYRLGRWKTLGHFPHVG